MAQSTLTVAATPARLVTGEREIPACSTLGSGKQSCYYRYAYDEAACAGKKCAKLVVYYSGGLMVCPDPANASSYLAAYVRDGYVAVCARLYRAHGKDGAGGQPFHQEASRADLLLKTITSDPAIAGAWNGEALLLSGVSHGATAPVVAMATTDDDEKPYWKGSKVTGACFFDGIYDAAGLLEWLHHHSCGIVSILSYRRHYSRYCEWHGGFLASRWPHPASCTSPDLALDTVVTKPLSNFAIADWKLVECGSGLRSCVGDGIPAEPIQQLCTRLAGDPRHRCDFASFPETNHIVCGVDAATKLECTSWFNRLVVKKAAAPPTAPAKAP